MLKTLTSLETFHSRDCFLSLPRCASSEIKALLGPRPHTLSQGAGLCCLCTKIEMILKHTYRGFGRPRLYIKETHVMIVVFVGLQIDIISQISSLLYCVFLLFLNFISIYHFIFSPIIMLIILSFFSSFFSHFSLLMIFLKTI